MPWFTRDLGSQGKTPIYILKGEQKTGMEAARQDNVIPLHPAKRAGTPNPVWDACVEALGYEPKTESELRLWGRMTTSLRRAGADQEKVVAVAAWYRKRWPDIDLTITAIEKWYSHFLKMAEARTKFRCGPCDLSFSTAGKLADHMHNIHEED